MSNETERDELWNSIYGEVIKVRTVEGNSTLWSATSDAIRALFAAREAAHAEELRKVREERDHEKDAASLLRGELIEIKELGRGTIKAEKSTDPEALIATIGLLRNDKEAYAAQFTEACAEADSLRAKLEAAIAENSKLVARIAAASPQAPAPLQPEDLRSLVVDVALGWGGDNSKRAQELLKRGVTQAPAVDRDALWKDLGRLAFPLRAFGQVVSMSDAKIIIERHIPAQGSGTGDKSKLTLIENVLANPCDPCTDLRHIYEIVTSAGPAATTTGEGTATVERCGYQIPVEVEEKGWQWRPGRTDDTAFAPPFGTIRQCRVCGCLVGGGPTACVRCVRDEEAKAKAEPAPPAAPPERRPGVAQVGDMVAVGPTRSEDRPVAGSRLLVTGRREDLDGFHVEGEHFYFDDNRHNGAQKYTLISKAEPAPRPIAEPAAQPDPYAVYDEEMDSLTAAPKILAAQAKAAAQPSDVISEPRMVFGFDRGDGNGELAACCDMEVRPDGVCVIHRTWNGEEAKRVIAERTAKKEPPSAQPDPHGELAKLLVDWQRAFEVMIAGNPMLPTEKAAANLLPAIVSAIGDLRSRLDGPRWSEDTLHRLRGMSGSGSVLGRMARDILAQAGRNGGK